MPDPDPDPRELRALGEFWDAFPSATALVSPDTVDPALLDAVAWVTHRDDAPGPDPAFVANLNAALLRDWPQDGLSFPLPPSRILTTSASGSGRGGPRPAPLPPARAHWALSAAATAMLLALTIVVAAMGLTRAHLPTTSLRDLLPSRPAGDPATAQGVLTEAVAPELPPVSGYVGIERLTYPPHSDPITTEPMTGPLLLFVTSGALTVSLDGEAAMLSSQAPSALLSTLATTTGAVPTGATLLVPPQTRMTTSNQEAAVATVLAVAINEDTMDDWVTPFNQRAIGHETLARSRGAFAPGEARITLRRTTLEPDASVPAPAEGAFQLVAAESKFLGYLTRAADGTVTNRERGPLVVLVAAITQPPPG